MFKKMITRALAVTLALPILIAAPLRASAADTVLDNTEWNAFVEEKIEKDDPPGLAVTLVNGSDVSFKNWRYANIKEQTPVTEDTVFGIASCSKAFTALSVYQDRFYRIILISGVVVAFAFTSCFCWIGYDIRYIYALAENSYYHQTFISVLWIGAFVLIALGISRFLLGKMEQTKAGTFICFCSRNLNVIYIIQWLIIAWTVAFVTAMNIEVKLRAVEIVLVGLLISLLSIGMIALWKRMKRRDSFRR